MEGIFFYLENQQVEDPLEFDEFTQEFIRDDENRILRYDYPTSLTFDGSGYTILEDAYLEDLDNQVTLSIIDFRSGSPETILRGVIKTSNCQWNLQRRKCAVQVDDIVFQEKIFARRQSPFIVTANETLDGQPMTSLAPIDLTFFTSSTGANIATTREVYDIMDCFSKLIEWITNGQVTFSSPWYDALPDNERMAIITGAKLRDPSITGRAPEINYESLFNELWKKDNLMLVVRDINGQGALELVSYDDTFVQDNSVKIHDIADLTRSLDFEQLYSRVRFGNGQSTQDFGSAEPLPYIPFLTFFEETYNLPTLIGVDKEFNLSTRWLIDTNQITAALSGNDENDSQIFIVQYDQSTNEAVKGQYYSGANPNVRLYNERMLNINIAKRFQFLADIVLNAGLLGSSFSAGQVAPIGITGTIGVGASVVIYDDTTNPHPYPDVVTPPFFNEGQYDPVTYIYTAPAAGFYRFRTKFIWRNNGTQNLQARLFRIRLIPSSTMAQLQASVIQGSFFNDAGVLQFSAPRFLVNDPIAFPIAPEGYFFLDIPTFWYWELTSEQTVYLNENEDIYVSISVQQKNQTGVSQSINLSLLDGVFETVTTPLSGGTYEPGDPNRFYIGKYTAENVPISPTEVDAIMSDPRNSLQIDSGMNDPRICYPQRIIRNFVTGKVDIETIFNRQQAIL